MEKLNVTWIVNKKPYSYNSIHIGCIVQNSHTGMEMEAMGCKADSCNGYHSSRLGNMKIQSY